jgi:hypothetical protein
MNLGGDHIVVCNVGANVLHLVMAVSFLYYVLKHVILVIGCVLWNCALALMYML